MKLTIVLISSLLMLGSLHAQTLSRKEARQMLESTWRYIKNADTNAFVNLWHLDSNALKLEGRPLTREYIRGDFNMVRGFLDTAILKPFKIDYIDLSNEHLNGTDTKYWIQAWFKYNQHYYKGFGLYLAYDKGQWLARNSLSTSTMWRP